MPERGAVARPRPVAGTAAEAGADRVLHDVARDVPDEVVVLEHRRAVPAVKEVSFTFVTAVEALGVHALKVLHSPGEVRARCGYEQVEVVPHEAVRQAPPGAVVHSLAKLGQESDSVTRVREDWQSRDSAVEDVVHTVGDERAGRSGHSSTVRRPAVTNHRGPQHERSDRVTVSRGGQTPYPACVDVDAYLARIGYTGPREPSERTLAELHRAHMLAVPFENLDIHLGVENVLDPEHIFDKIVTRRRGGWCYELNGLFALLLEALGFDVTRYSAAVLVSEPPSRDFAHLTLRVDLARPWLADVGFGASFTRPLRLDDDGDQERDGMRYRLSRAADGRTVLHEDGVPQYAFALEPRRTEQFAAMCRRQQTEPGSHFLRAPMCTLATGDGRETLSGMRLITTTPAGRTERDLGDEDERAAVLRDVFGVDLGVARIRAL